VAVFGVSASKRPLFFIKLLISSSQKRAASDQKLYLIFAGTVFWLFQTARRTDGHAIFGMAVSKIENAGS
jgi:hypothetical protein